jgi:ATPase subunit of ABC transporter with duplicated ATPase domains
MSSISFANVTWALPDGRPLYSNLNLSFVAERTGLVGRNGVGKTSLLKLISGELRPNAGKVSVTGRIGFLQQTVQVKSSDTVAHLLGVSEAWALFRRAQAGEAGVTELADVDWSLEGRILSALGRMGLKAQPDAPLNEMSGGERTRASLAAVLFSEPDFLLLDEPTNNLDREGRAALIAFLSKWRAGAIIVSHDRELLETVDSIVELTSLGATRYGGNWSRYRERKAEELTAAKHDLAHAQKRAAEVNTGIQATAEKKTRKDSASKRRAKQGGTPRIILGGLKNQSEGTSGAQARKAERMREEALEAVAAARQRIEIIEPFSVTLAPTRLPAGKNVLEIDALSFAYDSDQPIFHAFSMSIAGPERVALLGGNGSGKTTLLRLIAGELVPFAGSVRLCTPHAMLDQQAAILAPSRSIRDNFCRLNPGATEQACRASLARFRFRAEAALQTVATLSGGQVLRAALACVLGSDSPPPFLILDEPTNHLDLESIEAVEAGLCAYDGALLVASHDEAFLRAIGITRRIGLKGLAP